MKDLEDVIMEQVAFASPSDYKGLIAEYKQRQEIVRFLVESNTTYGLNTDRFHNPNIALYDYHVQSDDVDLNGLTDKNASNLCYKISRIVESKIKLRDCVCVGCGYVYEGLTGEEENYDKKVPCPSCQSVRKSLGYCWNGNEWVKL